MKKGIISFILVLTVSIGTMAFSSISAFAADRLNIQEGIYTIYSKVSSNKVLDISGGSTSSGGNLQLYQYNGTTSQLFWIQKSGSYYTITPMCSGLVLDVQGGDMKSGSNVQQYYSNDTSAQKWRFYDAGGGYCYIGCDLGRFALDVSGGSSKNGTNIQIYKPNGTASQKWELRKVYSTSENSSFTARTGSSNSCIVKIDTSLINKKGYQKASVKLKTFNEIDQRGTDGKVLVTLRDMSNRIIWSGVKSGGDTLKLGDDYPAYRITVETYDSGDGPIANGNDFINLGKTGMWGLTNQKNCQLYNAY